MALNESNVIFFLNDGNIMRWNLDQNQIAVVPNAKLEANLTAIHRYENFIVLGDSNGQVQIRDANKDNLDMVDQQ